jgi:hypothetical protein
MEKYPPYITRDPGDAVTSDDWNRLQELIREEIRQHGHGGEVADTNRLGPLGARIGNESLAEGAVTEPAFATGAVTARALQEQFIDDAVMAADAAISERENLIFDEDAGHDHDGVNSSPLAAKSVSTRQLADGAVTQDKLADVLLTEIVEFEQILSIPQVLSVSSAPGSTSSQESFVDIVGHGFGTAVGEVRLLKVLPSLPGEYQVVDTLTVKEWTPNRIRVRLPDDPTGLFQVVVGGLPLNAVTFNEALVVVQTSPFEGSLTVNEGVIIQIEFSTELLIESDTMDDSTGPTAMVLLPGETTPRPLVHEPQQEPPFADQPIEVFYGDGAARIDGEIRLSRDRKLVTFSNGGRDFPFNTPVLLKIYGASDQGRKPVLLAANTRTPMDGATFELRFRIRKQPPKQPREISIRGLRGKDDEVVVPENMISLANHHAVPIQIKLHDGALPSEWLLVSMTDGVTEISEKIPAIGDADDLVYVSLDARALRDGQVRVMAQAQNTTSSSESIQITSKDRRTGEPVDWVLKDTKIPYVSVHPVRTPTKIDTQPIMVDVEPGSTVTVQGGARSVAVTDIAYSGRVVIAVPLNPNTSNRLRVVAMDPAGNRSKEILADRGSKALVVVHDDTIPEITIEPVRTPTNQRIIEITGHANEPVTVVATAGGIIETDTADVNKRYRILFTLEPNTMNEIKIAATDSTGNTTPPVILRITHDDQPPPLELHQGEYSLSGGDTPTPQIITSNTIISLRGSTEPGATVILSGHEYRTTATAGADGNFTLPLPFRLEPDNKHRLRDNRSWTFELDAVDPSGNRTKQQKTVTVTLRYSVPDWLHPVSHAKHPGCVYGLAKQEKYVYKDDDRYVRYDVVRPEPDVVRPQSKAVSPGPQPRTALKARSAYNFGRWFKQI